MFSDRLKRILSEKGIMQRELADKIDISTGRMNNYYHARREPDHGMLIKIAKALDVHPAYFFDDGDTVFDYGNMKGVKNGDNIDIYEKEIFLAPVYSRIGADTTEENMPISRMMLENVINTSSVFCIHKEEVTLILCPIIDCELKDTNTILKADQKGNIEKAYMYHNEVLIPKNSDNPTPLNIKDVDQNLFYREIAKIIQS